MPLADFAGTRKSVRRRAVDAPDSAYGRPDDPRADRCGASARAVMVMLDVVYNHWPEGNYLAAMRLSPSHRRQHAMGQRHRLSHARGPRLRESDRECRLLAQRISFRRLCSDAVHAISEPGEISTPRSLSKAVGTLAAETGRHIHLVLENDDTVVRACLEPVEELPHGASRSGTTTIITPGMCC